MEEVKKIRTVCRSCHGGCGIIAHVKDGKGDPLMSIADTKLSLTLQPAL